MTDLTRQWTQFALEAEYGAYGMVRIVKAHNKLRTELEDLKRRDVADRRAVDYIRAALAYETECPCCSEHDVCVDGCTFADDDPDGAARMEVIRSALRPGGGA